MNKTGLIAKISVKYVLPICIWKYFWRILRYFAFFWEFRGISRKYLNFTVPRPREISEALCISLAAIGTLQYYKKCIKIQINYNNRNKNNGSNNDIKNNKQLSKRINISLTQKIKQLHI